MQIMSYRAPDSSAFSGKPLQKYLMNSWNPAKCAQNQQLSFWQLIHGKWEIWRSPISNMVLLECATASAGPGREYCLLGHRHHYDFQTSSTPFPVGSKPTLSSSASSTNNAFLFYIHRCCRCNLIQQNDMTLLTYKFNVLAKSRPCLTHKAFSIRVIFSHNSPSYFREAMKYSWLGAILPPESKISPTHNIQKLTTTKTNNQICHLLGHSTNRRGNLSLLTWKLGPFSHTASYSKFNLMCCVLPRDCKRCAYKKQSTLNHFPTFLCTHQFLDLPFPLPHPPAAPPNDHTRIAQPLQLSSISFSTSPVTWNITVRIL